ncbi:hypothetical protein [Succinatimonas hippei]|uniref:hypothetical protein n=1 Tax=Succinatimonas hippei TaxID=626938 RepID=UPI0023F8F360|nr:hypothetical protein [Succinatimonas hippei]
MVVDITKGEVLDFYVYFLNREGTKTFDKKRLEQEIKSRKNKIGQDSSLYFCSQGTGRLLRARDSSFQLVNDTISQNNANVKFEIARLIHL